MVQVGPQWSQWILKWPQIVPESPRQSFKFQKSSQVLPFSYQLFISTARCSRRSSVLNLSDKPLLILGRVGFWQIALSVPNGPSGSSMVPVDPQMAPDSPRESQTIIQVSEKFASFTRMEIDYLLAPPGDLGIVVFLNLMIISSLSPKSHPIHM